jgi:ribosomal protein S9
MIKSRLDRNTAIALALLPGIMVFVLEYVLTILNIKEGPFSQFDIVMHILGGGAVAWAAWVYMGYARAVKKLPLLPFWFSVAFAVGAAAIVGVLWEHYQFLHDTFLHTDEQQLEFGISDTMKDLANDLIGSFLLSVLIGRKMLKK